MSTSFPFLKIAREHGKDYGRVLRYADWVEAYYFNGEDASRLPPSTPASLATFNAVLAERARRAGAQP